MNKSTKRRLYRLLDKTLGKSLRMGGRTRIDVQSVLGGWLAQHKDGVLYKSYHVPPTDIGRPAPPNWPYIDLLGSSTFQRQCREAALSFLHNTRRGEDGLWLGRWVVRGRVLLPDAPNLSLKVALGASPESHPTYCIAGDWDIIKEHSHKDVIIAIAANYHIRVVTLPKRMDGRKIIQRLWEPMVSESYTVWRCMFWDFTNLGNDGESWKRCTHHDGFACVGGAEVVVDKTIVGAIREYKRRVVRDTINAIQANLEVPTDTS